MRDILINGKKVELPFIYEGGLKRSRYLVSYDTMNEISKEDKRFVFIELGDGFVYTMSKEGLEELVNGGGVNISKLNSVG